MGIRSLQTAFCAPRIIRASLILILSLWVAACGGGSAGSGGGVGTSAEVPAVTPTPTSSSSPDTAAPSVPTGLSATAASSSQINLSWKASTDNVGVAGYRVYRAGAQIAIVTATSYSNTGLAASTSYTYTVAAYDAAGNVSAPSAGASATTLAVIPSPSPSPSPSPPSPDTAAPSVPAGLSATAASSSQINLSWKASTDNVGVAGYRVYRAGAQIAIVTGVSYSNTGLVASTSYTYTVAAYDAAGNVSAPSAVASATTLSVVPPAPGSAVTSFQLSSGVTGAIPFTVGLAFKKGDVPVAPSLNVSTAQVIVKSRWNDGSAKHAIASGNVALTTGIPLTINVLSSSSVSSGTNLTAADIQAANPSASVLLGGIGTVNLSSLLATPFRTWISGPEMVEAHYRSPVGGDPTLSVWFYVRLYKNGQVWVRAVVENGYLDVTTNNKTYTPTVTIGGTTAYNNGGASLTHYAHTRWTADGWIGGDPQVIPKHDTAYLINTTLVPNYWKRNPSATALNNLYQTYSPMQNGGWNPSMGDTGFQPHIGLLPVWDALYVTSGADARAYKSVVANAKAINSFAIVWNDSATGLPTIPSNRPTWSVYGPNQGGDTTQGAGSLVWDVAHHGSAGYLAYLITGDYYYLETMEDQSSLCYLINSSSRGSGTSRLFGSQTRAVAWCTRTVGQLAGVAPSDSVANDYRSLLANNMAYWNSEVNLSDQNLIGYLYSYEIGAYGAGAVSPWQQHFWVQTYGHLSDLEPLSDMTSLNAVRDFLYKSIVGILGPAGTSNYCYTQASAYTLTISSSNNSDPTTWYDSWGQVYQTTNGVANNSCGTILQGNSGGDPTSASTGYWGNLLPAIAYAVDDGAPNASAAWSRLTGASNWSAVEQSGFDDIPIWGIVPRQ